MDINGIISGLGVDTDIKTQEKKQKQKTRKDQHGVGFSSLSLLYHLMYRLMIVFLGFDLIIFFVWHYTFAISIIYD